MELRKEFESETGVKALFYRQDYSGQKPYKDGFNDDYVEWLEDKIKKLSLSSSKSLLQSKEFNNGYTKRREDKEGKENKNN